MSDGTIDGVEPRAVFYLHWIVLLRPVFLLLFAAAGLAIVWVVAAMSFGKSLDSGILFPASLASVGLLVIAAGPLVQAVFRRETTTVEVFDEHIVLTSGLFDKLQRSVRASEVVGVDLYQDMSQRILGCGNLRIDTRGVDAIVIADLDQVETVKAICEQAIVDARSSRGGGPR